MEYRTKEGRKAGNLKVQPSTKQKREKPPTKRSPHLLCARAAAEELGF